jgi:uncharacterized protein
VSDHDERDNSPCRVLSIDGGGMRGIVPATILAELERQTGKLVPELFDVVVGTSTGSMLAVGLTLPDEQGRPKYKAADFIDMYKHLGARIFHKKRSMLRFFKDLLRPAYPADGIEGVLREYYGDVKMSELLCDVSVPSINLDSMHMHVFSTCKAQEDASWDFYVRDVVRAATAAETYFPAVKITSIDGTRSGTYVDAGLSTNNPAILGLSEAGLLQHNRSCFCVSLGTGQLAKPVDAARAVEWGEVQWLHALLTMQSNAQASFTSLVIERFLEKQPGSDFHRCQLDLHEFPYPMDDTRLEHLQHYEDSARTWIGKNRARLEHIAQGLV